MWCEEEEVGIFFVNFFEDFSLLVLLYNTRLMNIFKFHVFKFKNKNNNIECKNSL